uniref:Uncharacterized protein n=1 Tax=Rousettus aegyptiacus TaxID=9407 RepID=A0A7J8JH62_ROUAE|nr:hypothetical protein HJG63_010297 [Rousettus aegyptiacus]
MQRPPAAPQPRRRKHNSRSRHNAVLTFKKYNSNLRKCGFNSPKDVHIPFRLRDEGGGTKFLPRERFCAAVPNAAASVSRASVAVPLPPPPPLPLPPPPLPPPPRRAAAAALPQIQKQTSFSFARAGPLCKLL